MAKELEGIETGMPKGKKEEKKKRKHAFDTVHAVSRTCSW